MIYQSYQVLQSVIALEMNEYRQYAFHSKKEYFYAKFLGHPIINIMRWQKYARKSDYYAQLCGKSYNFFLAISSKYYIWKRNKYAKICGFEISTSNIGPGLLIFHTGTTVINSDAIIGSNCHINGNVCIGNGGEKKLEVPIIGNNVQIGFGAKIIGGVTIADNIIVGAGAVVTKSCVQSGAILIGVPAFPKIVK